MRRLVWRLRVALHDWMWGGKGTLHRAARRLPLYFSDPHYVTPAKFDARVVSIHRGADSQWINVSDNVSVGSSTHTVVYYRSQ